MKPRGLLRSLFLIAGLISLDSQSAHADLIRWQLQDFLFADGGEATGFFDWDTDTELSPNYEISVAGGNTAVFAPYTYTDEATVFGAGAATLFFFDDSIFPLRVFRIGFSALSTFSTPTDFLAPVPTMLSGPTGYVECFNCITFRNGEVNSGRIFQRFRSRRL